MKTFLSFLKLIGVRIGKRALVQLLPLVVQIVADLEANPSLSGGQKQARAREKLKKEAAALGLELTNEIANLLIEVAVNARREPTVDLLKMKR